MRVEFLQAVDCGRIAIGCMSALKSYKTFTSYHCLSGEVEKSTYDVGGGGGMSSQSVQHLRCIR